MAGQTFRTTPYPGDWTYVWSDTGGLTTMWQLYRSGTYIPLSPISLGLRSLQGWDSQYHQALQLPINLDPLQTYYLFNNGGYTGIAYTIVAPLLTDAVVWISPLNQTDAAADIQAKLQQYNVVNLAGGAYYLNSPIVVPPGRTLRGHDATLVRNYGTGDPQYHQTPIFTLTPSDRGVLMEGIQFVANRRNADQLNDASVVFAQNTLTDPENVIRNVTLRRCVFRNVGLGVWNMPGLLADECAWIEGGNCNFASGPCLYLRCQFRDLADPRGQQAWRSYGGFIGSGMALLDCDFVATDRGPIFQANNSTIQFNLLSGIVCDRLAHFENGCEGVGLEGHDYALNSNLIFHLRYSGEGPGIIISDAAANDNIFRDFVIDGGFGIQIGSGDPSPLQQNNKFLDGEIRGGRFLLGTSARNNVMQTCSFIGPRPTRGSLFFTVPVTTNEAVIPNVAGNPGIDFQPPDFGSVKFSRLLDAWTPTG